MSIRVLESPEELAGAAALDFAARAGEAVEERGRFVVALAGGSTPQATYQSLSRHYAEEIDWHRVHVFFGDERPVPPDHGESNYRMARNALLKHVQCGSVHRIRCELPPDEAAAAYEAVLQKFFGAEGPLRFDLILLGLGRDGHTVSLFPETQVLEVTDRLVFANPVPKLDTTRVTLTLPVINAARAAVFLVAGEDKAEAVKEVLEGDSDPRQYPARLVHPAREPDWMLDRMASRLLSRNIRGRPERYVFPQEP